MLPMVAGTLVKASTSWPETKPPVIATVALASVVLSTSATVIAPLTAVPAPFSV
ncbi:hypothetical protein ACHMXE_11450 [Variovorax sp. UC122_21]